LAPVVAVFSGTRLYGIMAETQHADLQVPSNAVQVEQTSGFGVLA